MRVEKKKRTYSTVYQIVSGYLWWKKVHNVYPTELVAKKRMELMK